MITVVLGCEISKPKTLVSNSSFEFAKRFFVDGKEVSHIPWSQKVLNPFTIESLATFLTELIRRSVSPVSLSRFTIRRYIHHFKGDFSSMKCLYLSVYWNLANRGIHTYMTSREIKWIGLPIRCADKDS